MSSHNGILHLPNCTTEAPSPLHHRSAITAATKTNVIVIIIANTNHVINLPKSYVQ